MIAVEKNRIVISREIEAAPEAVWEILIDTRSWPIWGPSVVDVDCNDQKIRIGSRGRVKTVLLFWLSFTVTKFRPLEYWSWRVGGLHATGHKLMGKTNSSCTLSFDMGLWAFAYVPVCWLALCKIEKIALDKNRS